MKILAVSDESAPRIHSPRIRERYGDVDLVIGCGDLDYSYMEFIATMLPAPCLFVHGNHDRPQYLSNHSILVEPGGWVNLDGRAVKVKGLIVAGLEGSMRYSQHGRYEYTESQMALRMWRMTLSLYLNRLFEGRYLDILATHAPPRGIHDAEDACHRGFESFLRLIRRFHPRYLLHGHIHRSGREGWRTYYLDTEVINVYPFRVIEVGTDGSI